MIPDHTPPPLWPHNAQGTVFNSGCPVAVDRSARERRNALSDPLRGSHHRPQSPSTGCS